MKFQTQPYKRNALLLTILILIITLLCIAWICSNGAIPNAPTSEKSQITADIYQNGELLQSIDLDRVTENYTFTVTGDNNCYNEIEVRPGNIGILSASCPDKLCVHQGFIDSTLLPITCLPNRLVIRLRLRDNASDKITPDIIGY